MRFTMPFGDQFPTTKYPAGDGHCRYGAQIARALDRANHAGVIHRDLKPGLRYGL